MTRHANGYVTVSVETTLAWFLAWSITIAVPIFGAQAQNPSGRDVSAAAFAAKVIIEESGLPQTVILTTVLDAPTMRAVAARLGRAALPNDEVVTCSRPSRAVVCRMPEGSSALRLVQVRTEGDSALVIYELLTPVPPPKNVHHAFKALRLAWQGDAWTHVGTLPTPVN